MTPAVVAALVVLVVLVLAPPPVRARPCAVLPTLRRPTAEAARRRAAELDWLDALAAELAAGGDPVWALARVPASAAVVPRAAAAAAAGADVVPALRGDATRSPTIAAVAACWEVAAETGAGLAASLAVLADAGRETERVRGELEAGLAEPRATAVVLACLPAVGLALGAMLGAEPLPWLVGTAPGRAVLAGGLALEVVGVAWSWRIARSLERSL